jgi:phospholipase/lecithinase/hemolysin
MPSYLKRLILTLPVLTVLLPSAQADSISAIYAFGDSLSDVGNVYQATHGTEPGAPYVNGQFSNGNVWVQDLATDLGLAKLTPSLLGGTDFAVGGAESGTTPLHTAVLGDLPSQLAAFQVLNPGGANPNGLYTIWIGSDDIRALVASNPSPAAAAADIAAVVGNIDKAIASLAGDGAKNFLVVTVPDLGETPGAIASGPAAMAGASALSLDFDSLLVNGSAPIPSLGAIAAADSLNLQVLDSYSLIDGIVGDPSEFGFTDTTQPCLTGAVNYAGGTPCANPNQYLFWDDIHPTAAGHTIIADAALATIVPEPATLTLLGAGALAVFVIRRRSQAVPKI